MAITVFKVLRALAGEETGRACRSCGESISAADEFGFSEGVCAPCRRASSTAAAPPRPERIDPHTIDGAAGDAHLRIMVEQMVREGRSEADIESAVRRAA